MPKTYNRLWEQVVSFENLYRAFLEARKGKRYKEEVMLFSLAIEENLIGLQNKLLWKSWSSGKFRDFYVYDPKKRLISAPPFEDRVVHHALVRIIEPLFEKKFIFDSYACRKGKGIHSATFKLQSFLRKAKRNWGQVYVLKADISKYFPSINHRTLLNIITRTIRDKDVLWLCETIIKQCGYEHRGIPVGTLTSQLFANIYLDKLDHFVKDDLGVKFYVRYMDDFVILGKTKSELRDLLCEIEELLVCELRLMLNPKTFIFPSCRGIDFAGYRIWTTHILPRKRNVKKFRRQIKRMQRAYVLGKIGLNYIKPRIMSFFGYMKHCASYITMSNILKDFSLTRRK